MSDSHEYCSEKYDRFHAKQIKNKEVCLHKNTDFSMYITFIVNYLKQLFIPIKRSFNVGSKICNEQYKCRPLMSDIMSFEQLFYKFSITLIAHKSQYFDQEFYILILKKVDRISRLFKLLINRRHFS